MIKTHYFGNQNQVNAEKWRCLHHIFVIGYRLLAHADTISQDWLSLLNILVWSAYSLD